MKMPVLLAMLPLALAGCATVAAAPRQLETIRYETTACFGFCPAYVVTVSSDGQGLFEPVGHTAAAASERFTVTPAQFAAFAARLRPVRPNGEVLIQPGKPLCGAAVTDQASVDVRWTGGAGDPRHLDYYFGCDMAKHADLRRTLMAAPGALPIAALVGVRR